MHIVSANILGFRSFAKPVRCSFSPGMNCIVGPSGCGKTNLMQSLLWAFGLSPCEGIISQGTDNLSDAETCDVEVMVSGVPGSRSVARIYRSEQRGDRQKPSEPHSATNHGTCRIITNPDDLVAAAAEGGSGTIFFLDEIDSNASNHDRHQILEACQTLKNANQLLIITHSKLMMALADRLIGVTMEQYRISKVLQFSRK